MTIQPSSTPIPETIPKPALRALDANGIHSLEAVSLLTKRELLTYHGIGPKAIRILEAAMKEYGLSFVD
ncbi:hypothetical protein MKY84_03720 [Chryseomicrobium sp. FSL W7-1435]|uniref:hypothetical protein n=1 Tax=Chryseomicrobium sp. FSL W7-1435 TaxID=2921704 RepID=UPI00315AF759